jgi:rhamnopyranosyl-N-acetylglucosaminyl-diphospho-decaprenol beta-1,3/1,4-galactofuranosyltransferase
MTPQRVATVVLTYNRSTALAETLRAIRAQTRPPDRVYVVDNAGDDSTSALLRGEFPDVIHLRTEENLGGGGRAHGIEAARADGFDAFWLVDDDSPPLPDALEALLAAAQCRSGRVGIIGGRGGMVRFGLIRHVADPHRLTDRRVGDGLFAVDFVLLDGSLVLRRTVDAIGVPRVDYFIMMEDVEYPLRARRTGFEVLLLSRDLMQRRHLGSKPGSALWRNYYQSRNHVRMALDFRSPSLFFGCVIRQAHFLIAALRAPDRRWERVKLRWRGLRDGLRGRMGRRVEPEAALD